MSILFRHNRLGVGLREKDYTIVWYEPIGAGEDGQEEEDGTAEIALFRLDTGAVDRRQPMEGEVAWFPWYDPDRFPSKKKNERLRLQKQFLNDAYKYCNAKDAADVSQLEDELDDPKYRKWDAWFTEAKKWKRPKMKLRVTRRKTREQTAAAAGVDDAEINSDTTVDSTYESEREERTRVRKKSGDMPPPPKPAGAGGKRKAASNKPKGKKQEPKRPKPSPSNHSSPFSSRHSAATQHMSGGLGSRRHSTVSGTSVDEDEEDGYISDDWSDRHPSVPPEDPRPNAAGPSNSGQLSTPSASRTQHSMSRSTANEGIRPSNEWGSGNGASANGDHGREQRNESPSHLDGDAEESDEDAEGHELNGGMRYKKALQAAMRASQAPEDGIEVSGEQGRSEGVRSSIEVEEKAEGEGDE